MTPVLNRDLAPCLVMTPCDAGASKCCHRFVSGSKGGPVDCFPGRLVGSGRSGFFYVMCSGGLGRLKGRNWLESFLHFNLQQC